MQISTLVFEVCAVFIAADGTLDPAEREHLERIAQRHRVDTIGVAYLESFVATDLESKLVDIAKQAPADAAARRLLYQEGCLACFADTHLAGEEEALLAFFARDLGLSQSFARTCCEWASRFSAMVRAGQLLVTMGESAFEEGE